MTAICPYCTNPAKLVDGDVIYPHRRDIAHLRFWHCAPCGAWVGVHMGTEIPLGSLATKELRTMRMQVHAAFDPLWIRPGDKKKARSKAYAWLAQALGITANDCHIGMFDEARCRAALDALSNRKEEVT